MDFDLSGDQLELQGAARDLLDGRCDRTVVRAALDRPGFDRELWAAMTDQGWLGLGTAEEHGGLGLGTVEVAVLLEQTGSHLVPVPFLQQVLALSTLAESARGEGLLGGEVIGTVARTPLILHRDGNVSGRPEPVIFGASADVLVVPARRADPEGPVLVAVDLADIAVTAEPAMDQTRELAWVDLDHAAAEVVGDADAAQAFLDRGATFHAMEMLGCADTVLTMAVEYAKEREQFGRPIGSFQAVKHRCADMLVDVEGMRSAAYYAAWAIGAADQGDEAAVAASTAKVWCSDAGLRVAESALQVHGGIGFTWESDVHLHLKRAQLDQVSFGDAPHHRARLTDLLRHRLATGAPLI
jgi:alkylation response protein AidB-like acyl-CoA dehydrogenase